MNPVFEAESVVVTAVTVWPRAKIRDEKRRGGGAWWSFVPEPRRSAAA